MTSKTSCVSTGRRSRISSCPLVLERLERRDQPSFITAPAYPVGPDADAVAIGDFNGDSVPDLAVTNYNVADAVTILKGNGDASFKAVFSTPAGQTPSDIITAELDGDGVLDLAVVNDTISNNLLVLKGNGNGTFAANGTYTVGKNPYTVVAADFDADGDIDLATNNFHSHNISVLRNNGVGGFVSAGDYFINTFAWDLITGDVNGDGAVDLIAAGWDIKILLGQGDGTFVNGASWSDAGPCVTAGDFDADGTLDLAVADELSTVAGGEVNVWLGNGDGTFAFNLSYPAANDPQAMVSADLNGDGDLDLATANGAGGGISLLKGVAGVGDGRFMPITGFVVGHAVQEVAAADLDGDADIDLVVPNGTPDGTVSVLRNRGDGYFQPAIASFTTGVAFNVESADFNGDGTPDLAVTGGAHYGVPANQVIVNLVSADGSLGTPVNYTVGNGPGGLVAADFNNDGFPDLATANGGANTISVLMNKGDGTFFPAKSFAAGQSPASIGSADFTGDGKLDIVVTNHTQSQTLRLLRGTGSGRFRAPQSFEAGPYPGVLTIADFESDGDADVAVVGCPIQCGDVRLVLGDGNGSFASPVSYPVDYSPSDIEAADVDNDDILDLVVLANGNVYFFQGLGNGTFSINFIYNPGGSGLEVADFNRDGAVDLALTHHLVPLKLMVGNGDGTFQIPQSYTTGDLYTDAEAADFNGDDYPDLAMNRLYTEDVIVALNAADWPPLPIGVGPRLFAPLDVGDSTEMLHPTTSLTQTSRRSTINTVDDGATAIRPKYVSRSIARVAHTETITAALDVLSTELT